MNAEPKRKLTPEEYLAIECAAEFRSEYYEGEMYPLGGGPEAMAGGSSKHSEITGNTLAALKVGLRDRPCRAYTSDLRVRVGPAGLYTYPDISVLCGKPEFHIAGGETLLNPQLIIEVLSPSTEAYDRGEKFRRYDALQSLVEYVLISQNEPLIMRYNRQGGAWNLVFIHGLGAVLPLVSVQVEVPLSDIYRNVEFTPAAAPLPFPPG